MKASGRVAAPTRTAKAANVAVARVHGDKTAAEAAKPALAPVVKPAVNPAGHTESKPAAKAVAKPAAKETPKPAAKEGTKPTAKDAPTPAANQPAVAKATSKPAATPAPTPAPARSATVDPKPAPQAGPADKPQTAKAAAAPQAMKIAAAEPSTTPEAPGTDEPAAAPRQVAPPPPPARPVPPPGHIDRRPGPVDRIPPRPPSKAEIFVEGDYVVYPTHGVGKVERIATEEIAGHRLELIHITFEENRMTLRVPVAKARSAGLRKLATRKLFDEAMAVLKGRARIKRTMWSRRAQEYEAKINSGDPLSIAEVVRDLHRNAGQPDQSFSERQIYEAAMDRLAAELAALDKTDKPTAVTKLGDFLKTVS
jgi:CarD family transcriptional regulator